MVLHVKTFIFSISFAMISIVCSGCMSTSLKIESQPKYIANRTMPVKFKFSEISWETEALPPWFQKAQISDFITLLKQRDPSLFSEKDGALPLVITFKHRRVLNNNDTYTLLAFCTLFSILPVVNHWEDSFTFTVRVGVNNEYVERYDVKFKERQFISLIPFFASLMPSQDDSFCSGMTLIDQPIQTNVLQDLVLNMIYSLDKGKLQDLSNGGINILQVIKELESNMQKIPTVIF